MIFDSPEPVERSKNHRSTTDADEVLRRIRRCEELDGELVRIAGYLNSVDYHFIELLSDFDELEGWVGDGIKSLSHWLNWRCGLGRLEAREKVRVARALRNLPQIREAFRNGEVSYSKVRAMTRVATPENEEYLMYIAQHGTAAHVEQTVRRYKRCRANDEWDGLDDWRSAAYHTCYQDDNGMYVFSTRLPPEDGELLVQAVNKMVDEIKRDQAAMLEKSGEEIAETEKDGENVSAETFRYDIRPDFLADRASALVHVAEHYLSTAENGAKVLSGPDRYHILLHINANDAHMDQKIDAGPCCYLDEGRFLAPQVARRLACAAAVTTVAEDDDGTVLNIGRRSRTPTRAISMAVQRRDGGCRFPGCYQTKWTDQHHIVHWADGGETSADNLVTLCRFHHTMLHQGKYTIERAGRDIKFINRQGETIPRALYPQFPGNPPPGQALALIDERNRQLGIEIDKHTAEPDWLGESMDYSAAIEALYNADDVD